VTVTIDEARERTATKLLRASLDNSYDPVIEIDWEAPPDPDKLYEPAHRVSLYGTPLWDRLDHTQRIELSKHEVASMAGVGIWFETILMQMLLRLYHKQDPTSTHAQYALTEVADECRHSVMFGRMIAKLDTPVYRVGARDQLLGRYLTATARGVRMFSAILIAEEILDAWQREGMVDESIQPIMRAISRIHVVEEARHVRWAREELERSAPRMGAAERAYSQLVIGRAAHTIARNLVNPDVYTSVGIDPAEGRRAALANPHHRETLKWAATKVVTFLGELGLVGGPGMPFWRRSGLI
jgi:hypothetical protein